MLPKRRTLAALSRSFNRTGIVDCLPFDFGHGVRLDCFPEEIATHLFITSSLGFRENALLGHNQLALIAEYDVSSPGGPDQSYLALQKLLLLNLAAWLSKPSGLNIVFYVHLLKNNGEWFPQTFDVIQLRPLKRYEDNVLVRTDLERARNLFSALLALPERKTLWLASRAIFQALKVDRDGAELRFILFWIALESLFGTDSEISYKLSLRLAFFNAFDNSERQELFAKAKKSYGLRCQMVHGMRIRNPDSKDEINSILYETEEFVRKSLKKVLSESSLISVFDSMQRDNYLNEILFQDVGEIVPGDLREHGTGIP